MFNIVALPSPLELNDQFPVDSHSSSFISDTRRRVAEILTGNDRRILAVVGPCSIHCEEEALEFAEHVVKWRSLFQDHIEIVMRCYFEKPRTRGGWKGLVYDPFIDGSNDVQSGLTIARRLMKSISEMGVPIGHELLDPVTPAYFSDLISWGAIGARTVESQIHRQLASDVPYPIGFKNATSGDVGVAIDAAVSSSRAHSYIGISADSEVVLKGSSGNSAPHVILRGGRHTNYDRSDIESAYKSLLVNEIPTGVIVDCSHANSQKDYRNQSKVIQYLLQEGLFVSSGLRGIMLESNLKEGQQSAQPRGLLKYGVSITDGCIGVEETESLLDEIYKNK